MTTPTSFFAAKSSIPSTPVPIELDATSASRTTSKPTDTYVPTSDTDASAVAPPAANSTGKKSVRWSDMDKSKPLYKRAGSFIKAKLDDVKKKD